MGTENIFNNGDIALQYKNTLDQEVPTKLHVVEFSKVPNGGLDGMKYSLLQDVVMLTVITWNVIVGLIYRALLFKYTWENGIKFMYILKTQFGNPNYRSFGRLT